MAWALAAAAPALLVRAVAGPRHGWPVARDWSSEELALAAGLGGLYSLALGLVFGSFLNVVAYRWPASLSLLWPPSRCDQCGARLAARDNVPVASWLWLGGRCRACGVALSIRYPLVELATGLTFLGLYLAVFVAAGWGWGGAVSVERATGVTLGRLAAWAAFTAGLASWLVVVALVELDRKPLPVKLWLVGLVGAVAIPLAAPLVQPLNWDGGDWSNLATRLPIDPALTSVGGGLLGLVAGALLAPRERTWLIAALSTTGLALGWQITLGVASCVAICRLGQLLWARTRRRPPTLTGGFPRAGWTVPALVVTLAVGPPLVTAADRAGLADGVGLAAAAVVGILLAAGGIRWLDHP